ncbi:MAG: hypothetical protein CL412_00265 [Acidimicrobiaceae bacterium]|nr:hypothetical protein [Acidimicrobiaceae bacterium]
MDRHIATSPCARNGLRRTSSDCHVPAQTSQAAVTIDHTGNTSSASIPMALCEALEAGRVAPGDHVLLVGFGGGMTAASAVLKWGGTS